MNTCCAFTIVAKNYIGLAQILGESLKRHSPAVDFKIVVADTFDDIQNYNLPDNVLIAKEFLKWDELRWKRMTFQYDLTQFCTAIKPGSILHFMDEGYEKVLYFDPDIFVFSSINEITDALDSYKIVLTPQIAGIHVNYKGEHPEWAMNCNGIFNLGFGGYRNTTKVRNLLSWWDRRLETECFSDRTVGNFTDQKWMDWVPGFFDASEFTCLSSLGMNLAPWNYFERKLIQKDGQFKITYRTSDNGSREDNLVFIHFAGYDYSALKKGKIKRKRIEELEEYEDLNPALEQYRDAIVANSDIFDAFINQSYSYSRYRNGDKIEPFHRRLYHGFLMNNLDFANPFDCGADSFYQELINSKMIDRTGASDISRSEAGDVSSKRRILAKMFKFIFKIIGYKRYVLFTKSLIDYCRPEFHTFLINYRNIENCNE